MYINPGIIWVMMSLVRRVINKLLSYLSITDVLMQLGTQIRVRIELDEAVYVMLPCTLWHVKDESVLFRSGFISLETEE